MLAPPWDQGACWSWWLEALASKIDFLLEVLCRSLCLIIGIVEVQPCRLWWRSRQRKPAPILDETTTDQCGSIGALFFTRPWNGMKQIRSSSHMNWRVGNSYYHLNTWFQGNNQWTIRNFEQGTPHVCGWCPYYLLGNRSLVFILQWWNMFNLKFAGEPASTPTFFSILNPIVNMVLTEHVFGENIPTQCL